MFGVCACTFVLICVGIDCVDLTKVSIYYGKVFKCALANDGMS